MTNGTVVLIFNTYELMQKNVVELIAEDKFRYGRVFSVLTRSEGHSVVYAKVIGTDITVTSRPEMMISKYGDYLIPIEDVRFFVDRFFEKRLENVPSLENSTPYMNYVKFVKDKVYKDVPKEDKTISLDHDIY